MSREPTQSTALHSRGVLKISGPDRRDFLQGLVTNDLAALAPGTPLYAAMLTPQGKYLFDFLVFEEAAALYLDCEKARLDDLLRRLTMYKLRSNVDLADASDQWRVVASWGPGATAPAGDCVGGPDPRHPDLGWRGLCPANTAERAASDPEETYDVHRLTLGIPDSSRDMAVEKLLILEGNLAELNGVSFTKGCYVGQELTARMNYRGKIRKRLLPVTVDGPMPEAGAAIKADGKNVGEIRSGQAGRALALLRVEDITDGAQYACGDAKVTVHVPDWLSQKIVA